MSFGPWKDKAERFEMWQRFCRPEVGGMVPAMARHLAFDKEALTKLAEAHLDEYERHYRAAATNFWESV